MTTVHAFLPLTNPRQPATLWPSRHCALPCWRVVYADAGTIWLTQASNRARCSMSLRLHGPDRSLTPSTNFDAVQPKLFRVARQDDYCFVIRTLVGAMSLFAYGAPILERDCHLRPQQSS